MRATTKNGHHHGDRLGHPAGGCPVTCAHRQWVESFHAARHQAEASRELETGNWPGDLAHYRATRPALPTLRDWMVAR